jgi:hypothetical protein
MKLILRERGAGRVIKRKPIANEALFYAIAFGLFGQKMSMICGGTPRNWMELISNSATQILLTRSSSQIEEWLTDNVLCSK